MKTLIRIFVTSLFALSLTAALRASAAALTQSGALAIDWTVTQESNGGNFVHGVTNKTATTTNIVNTYRATSTNETLNTAAVLKLLANSFNTSFPAGSRLVMGNNNSLQNALYVTDKTGTNVVLDVSSVVSLEYGTNAYSYVQTTQDKVTKQGTAFAGSITEQTIQFLTIHYDDSANTTTDGTHTVFNFSGVMTQSRSENFKTERSSAMFMMSGAGQGAIRGKPSVMQGTVKGTITGRLLLV